MTAQALIKYAKYACIAIFPLALVASCDNTDNTEDHNHATALDTNNANNTAVAVAAVEKTIAKPVVWLTVEKASTADKRVLSGQVTAAKTTTLSFESSGKINTIDVKLGEPFTAGQTLATLDTTNYSLQLQRAKATLATAIANKKQAEKEVKRFQRLVRAKAASAIQLDGYRLQHKTAQEAIKSAQAQILLIEKQLQDTTLTAPFDGVINAQLSEVGQLASPSVPILVIEAKTTPEVSLSIPESLIENVTPQQTVAVRIPAQKSIGSLSATVSEIATQAHYGAFTAKLILANAPHTIKAGMTAEVAIDVPIKHQGFHIPPSALGASKNNQHFVYRIVKAGDNDPNNDPNNDLGNDPNNRRGNERDNKRSNETNALQLELVPVTVTAFSDNGVSISGALNDGDTIVRSGWSFLSPKQAVSLIGAGTQTINP